MRTEPRLIRFATREAMAQRLADVLEAQLGRALAQSGAARLAVSGGSTPAALYRALAARQLDWRNVTAMLVDERWVPPRAPGSNEALARETFASAAATGLRLVGLWSDTLPREDAVAALDAELAAAWRPFDAVVLGMGADGHTASWFPRADGLRRALRSGDRVCAVTAPRGEAAGGLVERVSLTLSAIADARFICLLLAGEDKRAAYEQAVSAGDANDMPVRAILRARGDLWAAWAP